MDKNEAQRRVDAAIKELEAAKAALEQAQETDGRVIMKPSEVPVGEYFRYVNAEYARGLTCLKHNDEGHVTPLDGVGYSKMSNWHDHEPVYLTDPYGNAIEPCEELPNGFNPEAALCAIRGCTPELYYAFDWSDSAEGYGYWNAEWGGGNLSPSAAAKLRGMIHKWNKENGGQG